MNRDPVRWPQRSPLPKGAETGADRDRGGHRVPASTKSAPQRSGDEHGLAQHAGQVAASTKSAPQRSGDWTGRGPFRPAAAASTKSAPKRSGDTPSTRAGFATGSPQRSPLPTGAETIHVLAEDAARLEASTKSAPHRSGDWRRGTGAYHVGQPQRSPLPTGAETLMEDPLTPGVPIEPQRSPLPTGAETPRRRRSPSQRPRLNEVRSPQEQRPDTGEGLIRHGLPQRSPLPTGAETDHAHPVAGALVASTKSAPHRSGEVESRIVV